MAILPCHVNKGQRRVIKNQTIMNNEERHDSRTTEEVLYSFLFIFRTIHDKVI